MLEGGLSLSPPGLEDLSCMELLMKVTPPRSYLLLRGSWGA